MGLASLEDRLGWRWGPDSWLCGGWEAPEGGPPALEGTPALCRGVSFFIPQQLSFPFWVTDSFGIVDSWSRKKEQKGPWGDAVSAWPQSPPVWGEKGGGGEMADF